VEESSTEGRTEGEEGGGDGGNKGEGESGISAPLVLSQDRMEEVQRRLQALEEHLKRLQVRRNQLHLWNRTVSSSVLEEEEKSIRAPSKWGEAKRGVLTNMYLWCSVCSQAVEEDHYKLQEALAKYSLQAGNFRWETSQHAVNGYNHILQYCNLYFYIVPFCFLFFCKYSNSVSTICPFCPQITVCAGLKLAFWEFADCLMLPECSCSISALFSTALSEDWQQASSSFYTTEKMKWSGCWDISYRWAWMSVYVFFLFFLFFERCERKSVQKMPKKCATPREVSERNAKCACWSIITCTHTQRLTSRSMSKVIYHQKTIYIHRKV